jgi:TonB family protein
MSRERTSFSNEGLGSLRSCLMEGNADEEKGARKARRRALMVSIIVQILVLAALVLHPMLGHGERLAVTVFTPLPPYSYSGGPTHPINNNTHPVNNPGLCRFCPLWSGPTIRAPPVRGNPAGDPGDPLGLNIPGAPPGPFIPGARPAVGPDKDPGPPQQAGTHTDKPRISMGHIEAAMLRYRVEPVYPTLPLQLHREGRVELHAIIATDGSIQSLEVVSGDPLFYTSALAAVRQWRYRPTYLDGHPVEVDTQISVIYTLNR